MDEDRTSMLRVVLESRRFNFGVGLLILANAALIGAQVDYSAKHPLGSTIRIFVNPDRSRQRTAEETSLRQLEVLLWLSETCSAPESGAVANTTRSCPFAARTSHCDRTMNRMARAVPRRPMMLMRTRAPKRLGTSAMMRSGVAVPPLSSQTLSDSPGQT